jgi:alpha-L-fucosidase
MGVSYGYNRAEGLNDYHTARELVTILVDTVSRGGNFLLDIGPKADGTIPLIMEERLMQIGSWLKINGDAIYGSRPWKATRQWSAGDVPNIEYNKEYSAPYDVTKLTEKPAAGKAGIDAFFTTKGGDLYAILPHWTNGSFVLKDVTGIKAVSLLGSSTPLKFRASKAGISIQLPDLPEQLRQQPLWVLKLSQSGL